MGGPVALVAAADQLVAEPERADDLGGGGEQRDDAHAAHGSARGSEAANAPRRERVHVLESPDPVHLSAVLQKLDPKRTAVNIVSKSGTTLETLVKAVGIARKGKSIDQLQAKLGWTRVQVRNTVRRADAKGLIEAVAADVYRRKV